jgi:hypothetical protein
MLTRLFVTIDACKENRRGEQGRVSTGHFESLAGRGRGISRIVPVGFVQLHMRQLHVVPGVDLLMHFCDAYGMHLQVRTREVPTNNGGKEMYRQREVGGAKHGENHQ